MVNWPRLALRALGKRLPTVDGTLRVRGVGGQVAIARDRFGIPHITAENDADAWFAVGFCHGQDRAFQLETRLRLVRGTLAALTGPDGLPLDRLSRRIGFRRYGEEAVAALSPEHRRLAEAYARGVTAGVEKGLERQPHEFALLRSRPTPYQAADALGFLALQAFALASNWDVELARLKVLSLDGPEALLALEPPYPEWQPASDRPGSAAGPVRGPGGGRRRPPGGGPGPGRRIEQLGHRSRAHPHRATRAGQRPPPAPDAAPALVPPPHHHPRMVPGRGLLPRLPGGGGRAQRALRLGGHRRPDRQHRPLPRRTGPRRAQRAPR